MRAFFFQSFERLRASYWFIPAIMAVGAALLAFALVTIDARSDARLLGNTIFFFASEPDGARTLLGAIGGSMIGVAGTVFSVTIAAVVYASGQYGPRLLTNFMDDRGNQVTLGIFTATFVYAILVLRTVRSPGEAGSGADGALPPGFVPDLALVVAIVLAMCSIAVLIFFIHHVPSKIHISNVVANVGRLLLKRIGDRFPSTVGDAPEPAGRREAAERQIPPALAPGAADAGPPAFAGCAEVASQSEGYVEYLDEETLLGAARDHDLIVRLGCRPGSFLHSGEPIFAVWPAEHVTPEARDALLSAVALGNSRTPLQDLLFLFDELVEIAGRALSPAVNDPFTAVTCIDWMGAAMASLAGRRMPSPLRLDHDGRLRIIASPVSFEGYLERSFGTLRPYAARDPLAASHYLATLGRLARSCQAQRDVEALRRAGQRLRELSEAALTGHSLVIVREAEERLQAVLDRPGGTSRLTTADGGWGLDPDAQGWRDVAE